MTLRLIADTFSENGGEHSTYLYVNVKRSNEYNQYIVLYIYLSVSVYI